MTSDAGYIILPPLAAALYKAVGRAPLAGLAAVFAGVAAGFNANLAITSLEPMLSELATKGAQVIDPSYEVNPACNWWFMIASTIIMTGAGWFVADVIVEKRLANKPPEEGGPSPVDVSDLEAQKLTSNDKRALKIAGLVFAVALTAVVAMVNIPGSPLYTYEVEWPPKSGQMLTVELVEDKDGQPLPKGAIEIGGEVFVQSENSGQLSLRAHSSMSSQVKPSPENPSLHSHSNEPIVSLQSPFASHGSVSHSLIFSQVLTPSPE